MPRFNVGGRSLTFAGFGEEMEALVRAGDDPAAERLVQLKPTHDPDNLFRMIQNIKPAGQRWRRTGGTAGHRFGAGRLAEDGDRENRASGCLLQEEAA